MTTPVYLHVTLEVRQAGFARFCEAMEKAVPIIEGLGWKLLGAWVTSVGRLHTVVDLWQLEDANAYHSVMAQFAQHPYYPEFWDILGATLEKEVVTMMRKVPYSP